MVDERTLKIDSYLSKVIKLNMATVHWHDTKTDGIFEPSTFTR